MSSKLISGSSPSSSCCNYINSHGSPFNSLSRPYNFRKIKTLKDIDPSASKLFLNSCRKKHGMISRSAGLLLPKASSSSPPPSSPSSPSSWKKWLMGILFTVVLPIIGHKGGLILALKGKIDQALNMVENVTEIVEEIAEEADKLVDEVEKKLPDDSKLKDALESFEDLTKVAVKEAKQAENFIDKVEDMEKEIVGAILKKSAEDSKPQK